MYKIFVLTVIVFINIWGIFAESDEKKQGLPSSAVREGQCKVINAVPHLNITKIEENKTIYIPMASEHAYRLYAENLLGRPAKSYKELEEMCLLKMFARGVGTTSGFGRMYSLASSLAKDKDGVYKSVLIFGSSGTKFDSDASSVGTFVLSLHDKNKEWYYLVVRCINGMYADWQLMSSTPEISGKIVHQVTKKILELGFEKNFSKQFLCKNNHEHKVSSEETIVSYQD